ncbi:MAG: HNH endonuclease [Candidatus Latescibacteria bacterium]|nr:HNH endonuclease [Candidatus Latescibacterota bacterium]
MVERCQAPRPPRARAEGEGEPAAAAEEASGSSGAVRGGRARSAPRGGRRSCRAPARHAELHAGAVRALGSADRAAAQGRAARPEGRAGARSARHPPPGAGEAGRHRDHSPLSGLRGAGLRHQPRRTGRPGGDLPRTLTPALRRKILARDGHRCQGPGCTSTRYLEVHHRKPRANGGTNDPSNLITLCSACHQLHHARGPRAGGRRRGERARLALTDAAARKSPATRGRRAGRSCARAQPHTASFHSTGSGTPAILRRMHLPRRGHLG